MKYKIILFAIIAIVGVIHELPILAQEHLLDTIWSQKINGVHVIKFSPDGKYIFAGVINDILKVDVASGEILNTFNGYSRDNHKISFSPTGDTIICSGYLASGGAVIALYNFSTLDTIFTMFLGKSITGAEALITPDGKRIITTTGKMGIGEPQILVIDIATMQVIKTIVGSYNLVYNLNLINDGKFIIFTDFQRYDSCFVVLMSTDDYETKSILIQHNGEIGDIDISKDNRLIASCDDVGIVYILDLETKELKQTFSFKDTEYGCINSLAFSNDSKYILLANESEWQDYNFISVINIETNEKVYEYPVTGSHELEITKEDKIAASGYSDNEEFKRGQYVFLLNKKWESTEVKETKNENINYSYHDGKLKIHFDEILNEKPIINIYNILGMCVGEHTNVEAKGCSPLQSELEFDVGILTSGLCFVKIDVDGKNYFLKILIP